MVTIVELPPPITKKQVRLFVNFTGYYCCIIDQYAKWTRPMIALIKDGAEFIWDTNCKVGFCHIKEVLSSVPILRNLDWNKTFYINTGFATHMGKIISCTQFDMLLLNYLQLRNAILTLINMHFLLSFV